MQEARPVRFERVLHFFAPRDRNAIFEPQTILKLQRSVSEDIDKKIVALYGLGMSYANIQHHLQPELIFLFFRNFNF